MLRSTTASRCLSATAAPHWPTAGWCCTTSSPITVIIIIMNFSSFEPYSILFLLLLLWLRTGLPKAAVNMFAATRGHSLATNSFFLGTLVHGAASHHWNFYRGSYRWAHIQQRFYEVMMDSCVVIILIYCVHILFSVESLCVAQKTPCDTERSTCTDSSGTAQCQCLQGYYKHNPDDLSCLGMRVCPVRHNGCFLIWTAKYNINYIVAHNNVHKI